jgi:ataxia telangiectasia mutated family protein
VQIGWNIVLGDPVRMNLEDDDEDERAERAESLGVDDDDMYMDEELDEDEDEPMPSTSTQSLKRRRGPSATPGASSKSQAKSRSRSQPQKRSSQPPSLEQIECTSLLAILLRFPSAPLLSPTTPYLASSILRRLYRFIEIYPTDTSMHHDYILSVSATLSHLSLNKKQDITKFARGAWDGLVGLWGTKNKRMKEGLVGVLRALFPFYTATDNEHSSGGSNGLSSKFDCSDGISRLWILLDGEAESRWGVDGLSLDSLRLEVASAAEGDREDERGAFAKDTFRAGWHFDAEQAMVWAILDLQADCADKVGSKFHFSATSGFF